jgi:hypothetical protein
MITISFRGSQHMRLTIIGLAGCLLAAPVSGLAAQAAGSPSKAIVVGGPREGTFAPDFSLPWANRETVGSAEAPYELWRDRGENAPLIIRGEARLPDKAVGSVVICHGFKGFAHFAFFPYLAEKLAESGLRAITFDFSGSGIGEDRENFTNKEIAGELGISHRTVETHRESLMKKLGIRTVAGLTKFALETKLVEG